MQSTFWPQLRVLSSIAAKSPSQPRVPILVLFVLKTGGLARGPGVQILPPPQLYWSDCGNFESVKNWYAVRIAPYADLELDFL